MNLTALILDLIMPDTLSLISIYFKLCLTLCLLLCFLPCCPSALAVNVYEREGLAQCSPQEGDAVLVAGSTELYRRHHSSALLLS